MDELRLAQLLSDQDVSDNKKLEILKDLDITYTISGKSSAFQERTAFLGYNCLHIAAIKSDLYLAKTLVNLGANLLQKGLQDGKTPLRKTVDYVCEYSRKSVRERMGVLQNNLVNTLLSAQIKSNNPSNPKCKNGISHLHIACMFNHAEAVMFFARFKDSLDQAINADSNELSGYTPLHCAIRYSSSEAAIVLLTLGADIYLENTASESSICYLIKRLLDVNDYLKRIKSDYPHEKETERLDSILKVIVLKNREDDSKLVEKTGLSAFHLACALKDKWIMQSYICWDFKDINKPVTCKSKLWSGWTPLHFAACCNIQTLELLLKHGADIRMRNAKMETAFDLILQRYSIEIPLSYLSIDTLLSDAVTKLSDLVEVLSKHDTCPQFLQNLKDINLSVPLESPFWPGYNLLHLSVLMHHRVRLSDTFKQGIDYGSKTDHLVNVPKSEPLANVLSWERYDSILRKGCDVHALNADGLTPIHLAWELDEWHIAEELLARAEKNVVGAGDLSILHIACEMGKTDVVKRLLVGGADVNGAVTSSFERYGKPQKLSTMGHNDEQRKVFIRRNSTSLHVALLFEKYRVFDELLEHQIDVYAEDELGLTPLHLSLASGRYTIGKLLGRVSDLRDVKMREDGLSYLHVAAFAHDEKAVVKLLRHGADVNGYIGNTVPECLADFVGKTPFLLAVRSEETMRTLMEKGANVVAENPPWNFGKLLDVATRMSNSSFIYPTLDFHVKKSILQVIFEKLKSSETRIDALTASGLTTLHVACATLDLDWAEKLLRQGANPNARIKDDEGRAHTPLHLVIKKATAEFTLPGNFVSFVELLIEHGADENLSDNSKTPLHSIANFYCKNHEYRQTHEEAILLSIIDGLLPDHSSYVQNHTDADGFSYFHVACLTNNLALIKKYLREGVDINHSTSPFAKKNAGFTTLHFAIVHRNMDVIRLLLTRGADIKVQDIDGNTPLHLAINYFPSFKLFDTLLRKGADVNARNLMDETPILCLTRHSNIFYSYEVFDFFTKRGLLIDITETIYGGQGIIGFMMENTEPSDVQLVFEAFLDFTNVKDAINRGFLAIHNVVSVQSCSELMRDHYLNAIQKLTEIGSDIDEQDENGKRPLDKAIFFDNDGAIEALLLLGATVDVVEDENGYSSIVPKPWYHSREKEPVDHMKEHLWKMTLVKLDLSVSMQEAIEKQEWKPNDETMELYQSELEKMESSKIYKFLTAKHFLSECAAITGYPTTSFAERQAIDNFFNRTDDLRREFPEFAGILKMQYRKALARVKVMQPCKDILIAAGIDLPDLCLEAILKYFKNAELSFLINGASEGPPACNVEGFNK